WFPLDEFTAYHRARGGLITLALAQYRTSWGIVDVTDGGLIEGFTQSPLLPFWINAGVYVFEPEATALLPAKGDHESSTFPDLARQGRLYGYRINGFWRGVDTVKDVKEASEQIPGLLADDARSPVRGAAGARSRPVVRRGLEFVQDLDERRLVVGPAQRDQQRVQHGGARQAAVEQPLRRGPQVGRVAPPQPVGQTLVCVQRLLVQPVEGAVRLLGDGAVPPPGSPRRVVGAEVVQPQQRTPPGPGRRVELLLVQLGH